MADTPDLDAIRRQLADYQEGVAPVSWGQARFLLAEVERLRAERDELQRRLDDQTERLDRHRAHLGETEAERDRLVERLRPFAEFLDALEVHGGWDPPDGWIVRIDSDPPVMLAFEELVRARKALLDTSDREDDGER